jgi:hypothetical protein
MSQYVGANAVYPGLPQQTNLQSFPPAYVFQEYSDDDNIQAFNTSYNDLAEQFLLWFNTLNLPIYTGGIISGSLLDWVAQGLYGTMRPSVSTGSSFAYDAINSVQINYMAINERRASSKSSLQTTNDDYFRRVLTWNLFKGDGFVFNMAWLKRRIWRFMTGPNGIDPGITTTYPVSVTVSGSSFTVNITTTDTVSTGFLSSLINAGILNVPFQYSFTINAV